MDPVAGPNCFNFENQHENILQDGFRCELLLIIPNGYFLNLVIQESEVSAVEEIVVMQHYGYGLPL